ncbi:12783_t:CDS:2 [Entrophospora sp. SA101]|nr:12783_t:CDS:2 [Entrophospora sp. SA101]
MSISTSNGFEVLLPSPLPDFSNPLDNKKSINLHDRSFMSNNNSSMRNNVGYYNSNNDDGRSSGPIILTPLNFDTHWTQ